MSQISVLFVPFDAVLKHYRKNASNGVDDYIVQQLAPPIGDPPPHRPPRGHRAP